jgi:hypothetical protein
MSSADGHEGARVTPVPEYAIRDRQSFDESLRQHPVARLYYFYTLDSLIDLAKCVAHDFVDRPELFTRATGLSRVFAQLFARYGAHEDFLDRSQRAAIYSPVFGTKAPTLELGNFARLRRELLDASVTYVETRIGDERALRENVLQKVILFRDYVNGLSGESLSWGAHAIDVVAEQSAFPVLRCDAVAAVYGVTGRAGDNWPYSFDSNGPKVVERASDAMSLATRLHAALAGALPEPMSREQVTKLQRAAVEGARAIATATTLGTTEEGDARELIQRCYTWATALRNLHESTTPVPFGASVKPLYSALMTAVGNHMVKPRAR